MPPPLRYTPGAAAEDRALLGSNPSAAAAQGQVATWLLYYVAVSPVSCLWPKAENPRGLGTASPERPQVNRRAVGPSVRDNATALPARPPEVPSGTAASPSPAPARAPLAPRHRPDPHMDPATPAPFAQQRQVRDVIIVLEERLLPAVPMLRHMVSHPRNHNSRQSRHVARIPPSILTVNQHSDSFVWCPRTSGTSGLAGARKPDQQHTILSADPRHDISTGSDQRDRRNWPGVCPVAA